MASQTKSPPQLSLVVAFGDCEESIGRRIGAWAERLRALGRPFEIVAVNEGSRDNSVAVLALLATRLPELRLVERDASGRAFARGIRETRGDTLVLTGLESELGAERPSGAPLGWAIGRLDAGADAVVVHGHFVAARAQAARRHVTRAHGPSARFEAWFERVAAPSLRLHVVGNRRAPVGLRSRLLASLTAIGVRPTDVPAPLRRLLLAAGLAR